MLRPLTLACFLLLTALARAGGLFDAGAWAPIILPTEPEIDELSAARSLADWCERVTGVRPETRYEAKGVRSPALAIYVGKTAAARSAGIKALAEEGDTARRAVVGQSVFLVGNNPAATRIAVGRFCEQHLGVFFAFPGELGADWRPRYQIGFPGSDEFRPDFRWRQLSGLNELSEDWAFSVGYGRTPGFSHGLYRAFDQKLWKQEPLLFAMVGGKAVEPRATRTIRTRTSTTHALRKSAPNTHATSSSRTPTPSPFPSASTTRSSTMTPRSPRAGIENVRCAPTTSSASIMPSPTRSGRPTAT